MNISNAEAVSIAEALGTFLADRLQGEVREEDGRVCIRTERVIVDEKLAELIEGHFATTGFKLEELEELCGFLVKDDQWFASLTVSNFTQEPPHEVLITVLLSAPHRLA